MAHLFSHAGAPWLTQYWVRRIEEEVFGDTSPYGGYNGDEDQGQMGALGVLMTIGLFDVQGGAAVEPRYEITRPVFDRVVIALDKRYFSGAAFTIETRNNRPGNVYIQSARLNGKPLNGRFWITHKELVAGGRLALELGPKPNKSWGVLRGSQSERRGSRRAVVSKQFDFTATDGAEIVVGEAAGAGLVFLAPCAAHGVRVAPGLPLADGGVHVLGVEGEVVQAFAGGFEALVIGGWSGMGLNPLEGDRRMALPTEAHGVVAGLSPVSETVDIGLDVGHRGEAETGPEGGDRFEFADGAAGVGPGEFKEEAHAGFGETLLFGLERFCGGNLVEQGVDAGTLLFQELGEGLEGVERLEEVERDVGEANGGEAGLKGAG